MHNAPSVTYPVGRSPFFGRLLLAAWLLGAVMAVWWCLQAAAFGWRQGLVLAAVPLAGWAAASCWFSMGRGELRWDGQAWLWQPGEDAVPARLTRHVDLQRHLLLCLHCEDGTRLWCWAERATRRERWDDLRRAVYSPAVTSAPSPAGPDAAATHSVNAPPASPET